VRPLLYLGQSNNIAVLYDSTQQQALYLPLSSITLRIDACKDTECLVPRRVEIGCANRLKNKDSPGVASLGLFNDGNLILFRRTTCSQTFEIASDLTTIEMKMGM
jgi:hypothetical protein